VVEDTRKTLRTDTYRPVNTPEPVSVEEDTAGLPVAFKKKRRQKIAAIDDRWRIDDEWWRPEPVVRLYYAVRLASGERLVLFRDLAGGGWYEQDY
jgi:hypothetical protein